MTILIKFFFFGQNERPVTDTHPSCCGLLHVQGGGGATVGFAFSCSGTETQQMRFYAKIRAKVKKIIIQLNEGEEQWEHIPSLSTGGRRFLCFLVLKTIGLQVCSYVLSGSDTTPVLVWAKTSKSSCGGAAGLQVFRELNVLLTLSEPTSGKDEKCL